MWRRIKQQAVARLQMKKHRPAAGERLEVAVIGGRCREMRDELLDQRALPTRPFEEWAGGDGRRRFKGGRRAGAAHTGDCTSGDAPVLSSDSRCAALQLARYGDHRRDGGSQQHQ